MLIFGPKLNHCDQHYWAQIERILGKCLAHLRKDLEIERLHDHSYLQQYWSIGISRGSEHAIKCESMDCRCLLKESHNTQSPLSNSLMLVSKLKYPRFWAVWLSCSH